MRTSVPIFAALTCAILSAPFIAQALTLRTEGTAGCLALDPSEQAGPEAADRNVRVLSDCSRSGQWALDPDQIAEIATTLDSARMCLTVDFRQSLQGDGRTFNVFAAADCAKALFWEVRGGFIAAEIASTIYCLEAAQGVEGGPSNAIARIGCSGEDDGVWRLE